MPDFYVSPTGLSTNSGSLESPWNLDRALQLNAVPSGSTIWLRAGNYPLSAGGWNTFTVANCSGASSARVVYRSYPNERAKLDGRFIIRGAWTDWLNIEFTCSDTNRVTAIPGSGPTVTNFLRAQGLIDVEAGNVRILNCFLYDLGNTIFAGNSAPNLELYGNIIWNNGYIGPDRGHGHGCYLQQDENGSKLVKHNVFFQQFSTGIKIGGTSNSKVHNISVIENVAFCNGTPSATTFGGVQLNAFTTRGDALMGPQTWTGNQFYHKNAKNGNCFLGADVIDFGSSMSFNDNIAHGRVVYGNFNSLTATGNKISGGSGSWARGNGVLISYLEVSASYSTRNINNNLYAYHGPENTPFNVHRFTDGVGFTRVQSGPLETFPQWQSITGWDTNSTRLLGEFTGSDVVINSNEYEVGRANVTVWNWSRVNAVSVDLSSVLNVGDQYQIHHVYDVFGAPLMTGTFTGAQISLPMTGHTPRCHLDGTLLPKPQMNFSMYF